MQTARTFGLTVILLLGLALSGCNGGSGSSGFEMTSENMAIDQALMQQHCVVHSGLQICPADETRGLPPTLGPGVPTPTPVSGQATPPVEAPRIDTAIDASRPLGCVPETGTCAFSVPFAPAGLAPGTTFRIAVRAVDPNGRWMIGPLLMPSGAPNAPDFDAPVAVETAGGPAGVTVQLAILAFMKPQAAVPSEVDELGQTEATFAFVTTQLRLAPVTSP